jgi:hypothetical protein
MLVALAITSSLLTAALVALDTAFKSYKVTTDSASTHVVSRIVLHRISTMIRTGKEFGPYPIDVLDPAQNPVFSNELEFVSDEDPGTNFRQVTILRAVPDLAALNGTQMLELTIEEYVAGGLVSSETRPLIRGLTNATFTLEYDVGPKLRKATIDMTIRPDDTGSMFADTEANTIRLVTTASPRTLD